MHDQTLSVRYFYENDLGISVSLFPKEQGGRECSCM
jgi:hypothetical protein